MTQEAILPFNPRSAEFRANPYPTYHYLRTHHPIYFHQGRWLLTRYADVFEVLKNPNFGHSESGLINSDTVVTNQSPINQLLSMRQESQQLISLWLLLRNPPEHTRLRKVLGNHFNQKRMQTLQLNIQAKVNEFIKHVEEQGKMDTVNDLAYPLMSDLICEMWLGIPKQEQHPNLKKWSDNVSLLTDLEATSIANEQGLLAIAGLASYFRNWIDKCRTNSKLQNNLVGAFIQAEGQISQEEILAHCIIMYFAACSTTKHSISNTILTLLNHPEQLQKLQADPTLIKMTISEVLRYDSPVQGMSRTALSDIQLSNQTIRQGEIITCLIGAANRDPAQFPEPDKFDIQRQPNPHLSFGRGIHICVGRHLAQLVAEIAVGTLVCRFPKLSLATDTLEWDESFLAHGLKSLPVTF